MEKQDEIQVKKQTQRTINEMVGPIIFNAYDLVNNYISECRIFSCGNSKLDEFLGGGIFTGELLEVVGPSAVGKTQFCIYSSIQIALNTDYSVLVIDSCASFSVDRAKEMIGYSIMKKNSSASRDFIHQEIQRVLSNIYCFKIFDIFSLINFLDELQVQLTLIFRKSQNYDPFYSKLKVLVIDSLGSILSVIVDKTPFGHSLMIYVSRILKYLATHFHLAIIYTNFTVSGDGIDLKRPALGESWSYVSNTQLFFDISSNNEKTHFSYLLKSSHPTNLENVQFQIGPEGIEEL